MLINSCPNCRQTQYIFSTDDEFECGACGYTSENTERDYYSVKFRKALTGVLELARGDKTSDYGEAWKTTGLVGIYIKLMIKESRLRSLVWEGNDPKVNGESVLDTLQDIIAYATYGILCLDEDNIKGSGEQTERLESMFTKLKEELDYVRS